MSFAAALRHARVVAILRRSDIDDVIDELADELFSAGIRAVEITLDQPSSFRALERLVGRAPSGVLVGAGTVLRREQLDRAVDLGVSFVVCPHLDTELIRGADERRVDILPGIATPTELLAAHRAGAAAVKLFPAGPLGPAYLKTLRGPFPDAAVVPTGGIGPHEVATWLDAGAAAVGIGSSLLTPQGIAPEITELLGGPR